MVVQLLLYQQLDVSVSFFLMYAVIKEFEAHTYFSLNLLRDFIKNFITYLIVNRKYEFTFQYKDPLKELEKIDNIEDDISYVKAALRIVHSYTICDIPIIREQEDYLEF